MAQPLFVLEEVLAMLRVVDVAPAKIAAFRRQAEAVAANRPQQGTDDVTVSSGYGSRTQRGFVELTMNRERSQMEIAKAREIGLMLLEAAEAATSDEIYARLLRERVGIEDPEQVGRMLIELRELRQGSRDVVRPQ